MYDESYMDADMMAAIVGFYLVVVAVMWIGIGIINHVLLSKKGYRNVGLYILAWLPIINYFTLWLFMGLPDALLHKKLDYLYHQLQNGASPAAQPSAAYAAPANPMGNQPPSDPGYHQTYTQAAPLQEEAKDPQRSGM